MLRTIALMPLFLLAAIFGCGSNESPENDGASSGPNGEAVTGSSDSNLDRGAVADTSDPDYAALAGTWKTVRMVSAGEELPPERMRKNLTMTIEGNKMITKINGEERASWPFTIDSSKSPKQLIINTANPGEKERLSHQIYKIEGDKLTTCSGGRSFPTEFTENTVKGCYLTIHERVAP